MESRLSLTIAQAKCMGAGRSDTESTLLDREQKL